MRGADEGPESHVTALSALWVGLLYDTESKAAAQDLTHDWTVPEMQDMRYQVCLPAFVDSCVDSRAALEG